MQVSHYDLAHLPDYPPGLQNFKIDYFLGKKTVKDIIPILFPNLREIFSWCDTQQAQKQVLKLVDVETIFYTADGLIGMYMLRCQLRGIDFISPIESVMAPGDYALLSHSCLNQMEFEKYMKEKPYRKLYPKQYAMGNAIACHSDPVGPNELYIYRGNK